MSFLEAAFDLVAEAAKQGKRTEIFSSSAITAATYDYDTQELEIQFANGPTSYAFHDVPPEIFEGLVSAPSAGRYYHAFIKGNYA